MHTRHTLLSDRTKHVCNLIWPRPSFTNEISHWATDRESIRLGVARHQHGSDADNVDWQIETAIRIAATTVLATARMDPQRYGAFGFQTTTSGHP